jgi:hypothetical protein
MTLREVTALCLLYRACPDADVKRRVLGLIPELEELVVVVPGPDDPIPLRDGSGKIVDWAWRKKK